MSNENLELWGAVSKTDAAYTKPAQKGQFRITSIAPVYQFKQATEQWGPYGGDWGVKVDSETFHEREIGETILLNYDAVFYYPGGSFNIHATERLAYKTNGANGYLKIDDEARKKVVTNAITKGLSMLGFNADVFMGMFDDVEYVQSVATEFAIEKAVDKDAEIQDKRDELKDYVNRHIESINNSNSENLSAGLYKVSMRHLDRQKSIPSLSDIAEWGMRKIHSLHEQIKKDNSSE